ncbi:MAG: nitronate monooxygenase, partial [Candidatus Eremiobacteraeota bacterium]|nr:nitronate monooxygenase [Candidatus Eremiobacteraeota bacterium]
AMYPCSNPELVAAASEAGGIGIVQPLSLIFVHGYNFREGLRHIRSLTSKPIGLNVLTEQSSKAYLERMSNWLDISLEEGVRFFVTSLGNPRWVVDRVKPYGGVVYHDITLRKWAIKGAEAGVDGLICVNRRAGGHAGELGLEEMYNELKDLGLPLVAAGGISTPEEFSKALAVGYEGVQMGTRFIATAECTAHEDYKKAIVEAQEADIVHTEKISGVPVAVINTPYVQKVGTKANRLARWMLRHPRFKHWMRAIYSFISLFKLSRASKKGSGYKDYWQAGKSVQGIDRVETVDEVMSSFRRAIV